MIKWLIGALLVAASGFVVGGVAQVVSSDDVASETVQAANVLDYPVGTVKTHIARGKIKLREHLASYGQQREQEG